MLKLTRLLGKGGMGSIWMGEHSGLESVVVVKFLSEELSTNKEALARFRKEAAASIQIKSPHVVQVFDHGITQTGIPYIVMEHLEGQDLGKVLQNGPLPPREVSEVVRQVARALTRAHAAGVVHRDLKPENIFLCESSDGEAFVKILDFGIAKVEDKLSAKTQSGAVLGTPFYMSPEQILGQGSDSFTDLWALGVVAFESLTGKRPFEGETVGAVTLAIHTTQPTPRMYQPLLPAALDVWFNKTFAKEKADRYATAKEMADTFVESVTGAPSAPAVIAFRAPMASIVDASGGYPAYTSGAPSSPFGSSTQLESTTGLNTIRKERKVWPFVGVGVIAVVALGAGAAVALRSGEPSTTGPTLSSAANGAGGANGATATSAANTLTPSVPPPQETTALPSSATAVVTATPTASSTSAPHTPVQQKGIKPPGPVVKLTPGAKPTASPKPASTKPYTDIR